MLGRRWPTNGGETRKEKRNIRKRINTSKLFWASTFRNSVERVCCVAYAVRCMRLPYTIEYVPQYICCRTFLISGRSLFVGCLQFFFVRIFSCFTLRLVSDRIRFIRLVGGCVCVWCNCTTFRGRSVIFVRRVHTPTEGISKFFFLLCFILVCIGHSVAWLNLSSISLFE